MTFDTLAASRNLEDAGLTSKEDIFRLEARLAELELRLTWRILGGVGALLAVAVAVARLLFVS